ncbi:MAG: hypothetical protein ACYTAF_16930, partial [Planctomycetota bacterium]
MKASYLWRSGEFKSREVVVEKTRRVEIGGGGADRLEVPGAQAGSVWATVEIEGGRCYLTPTAPPVQLAVKRKVKGEIETLTPASGERVETKSNDLLILGPGGPEVLCQYELEIGDMMGVGEDDLKEAVSPLSADRRLGQVRAHSAAKKVDVSAVRRQAE